MAKIGIVGAGVAGLQVANVLRRAGMECTILEKNGDLGGVWRRNYVDFGLQTPAELYVFPGYPHPSESSGTRGSNTDDGHQDAWAVRFPSGHEVYQYVKWFAQENELIPLIKFGVSNLHIRKLRQQSEDGGSDASAAAYPHGSHVSSINIPEADGWKCTYSIRASSQYSSGGSDTLDDDQEQIEYFDYIVIATGMYNCPNIPSLPDSQDFAGEIIHSCEFTDLGIVDDKRVVVVGAGKSAIDCATVAATVARKVTMVFRDAHWPVPRYLLNLVSFKWATFSRFGHFMFPAHHSDKHGLLSYLHLLARPFKWIWWRLVELLFKWQFKLSGEMIPSTALEVDLFNGGLCLDYEFRDRVNVGEIRAIKSSIERITERYLVLKNGSEIEADVVIYATGFKKAYDYMDPYIQTKLFEGTTSSAFDDGLYLYRNILPLNVSSLAFIGAEVTTFNNILTQGLQALWLRDVLLGKIELPPVHKRAESIEDDQIWKRAWMPDNKSRAATFQLHMMKYHDVLCQDMHVEHLRKANIIAEIFQPYDARDYASLFA
ncbi:hypothetical protein CYMTET_9584 [Cymbomonas tetramitiformis]|uniref:Flavin-containing monooxygenase n=1 Tax=Cymbomonas tetramitiformis TaxID=36881 RepID=A0AAE0GQY3_9CHLO|nr:hypothetical protein CYMTET_9584 [Cymbomonas tetramitiformis]|eukprot:gene6327-7582_t